MYVYVAVALIAAALSGLGTWRVQEWRHDAIDKARLEHEAEVRRQRERAIDLAADGHEKDKAKIQTEFVTIIQEVERVVEKPFYRDLCLDDDGLRELRAAIGGVPASQPASAVPRPADAR